MEPAILLYGKAMSEKFKLAEVRSEFVFDFPMDEKVSREFIGKFIRESLSVQPFDLDKIVIVHKILPETGLKWHIDDCQLVSRKEPPEYNIDRFIHMDGTNYLYCNNALPKFTILFYSSTFGKDFTGGILRFGDGAEITPRAGCGVMFDSREVHMVSPVKSGIRKVSLVKVY